MEQKPEAARPAPIDTAQIQARAIELAREALERAGEGNPSPARVAELASGFMFKAEKELQEARTDQDQAA